MKITAPALRRDVIHAFLEAELNNPRHEERYKKALTDLHLNFEHMDDDTSERLLVAARGWPDKLLFRNFPKDIVWKCAELRADDLANLRYINYSYWNELSGGTGKPVVAASNIQRTNAVYGQLNNSFYQIAEAVDKGVHFAPLLLAACSDGSYTIIEGHMRATGFSLARRVPERQRVIIGYGDFDKWAKEGKD
jgi:hypothetical protein